MKQLPKTFEETMEFLTEFKEFLIKQDPSKKRQINSSFKKTKKELSEQNRSDEKYVPKELRTYAMFSHLSQDKLTEEMKTFMTLKEMFKDGKLSFQVPEGQESLVTIHTNILSEFGLFESEVIGVRELMRLMGMTNYKGK